MPGTHDPTARSSARGRRRPPLAPPTPSGRSSKPGATGHRSTSGKPREVNLDALPDARNLDLTRFSEATRAALYKLAVAAYWTRFNEADEYEIPSFTPEEAELMVHFFCGRWFVAWRNPDLPVTAPLEDAQPLLQIERNPCRPLGLSFSPC